ncbi:hypothetical protein V5799_007124 [Amblyomma americanum]|uniref:Uncharacterized protein n=1 Tax=Amblyomma americanum TaxID=6943 RepID=A0AAQ4DUF4_AMBAM
MGEGPEEGPRKIYPRNRNDVADTVRGRQTAPHVGGPALVNAAVETLETQQKASQRTTEYAAKLCRENWQKTCDSLQGKLSTEKAWCLLRNLIDPLSSKTATNRNLTKVLNTYKGDGYRLLEDLKTKYLKTEKGQYPVPERYEGPDNEELDRPFTMTELCTAIDESNKRSAPGRDAITYKLLGNMSRAAARGLLEHINEALESSRLPKEWKD